MTNSILDTSPTTPDAATDPMDIAVSLFNRMEQAWNDADGGAFAAVFVPDTEFVDVRGGYHHGREEVADGHQALFDSIYAGSTVRYVVDVARSISPRSIVALASGTMCAPIGPLRGTNHARMTVTIVNRDDEWAVVAFHNTLVAVGA